MASDARTFIREKGAVKLLRNWPFDEPPPDDAREVYAWIKAGEHAREQNLSAYANTVREMIADGLVRKGELRLLEGVRRQLGISEREHEKVLARLSEEERDLFEQDRAAESRSARSSRVTRRHWRRRCYVTRRGPRSRSCASPSASIATPTRSSWSGCVASRAYSSTGHAAR